MVFGVLKIVIVQESYTIWQKSMFLYTQCVVLSIGVGKHSMDLTGEVNV